MAMKYDGLLQKLVDERDDLDRVISFLKARQDRDRPTSTARKAATIERTIARHLNGASTNGHRRTGRAPKAAAPVSDHKQAIRDMLATLKTPITTADLVQMMTDAGHDFGKYTPWRIVGQNLKALRKAGQAKSQQGKYGTSGQRWTLKK